jgi:GTP cyclohydrolase II
LSNVNDRWSSTSAAARAAQLPGDIGAPTGSFAGRAAAGVMVDLEAAPISVNNTRSRETRYYRRIMSLVPWSVRSLLKSLAELLPVRRVATARLPTDYGEFDIHVYKRAGGDTHVALVCGDIGNGEHVLTRVHSACLTGDIFHSARCDCGGQLNVALQSIATEGRGVLLYLNQEGRGIGLANKIRAYALQDQGLDTVEANERLGFPADSRDYRVGARILRDLGVRSTCLLSNNPKKLAGVITDGLSISERLPIEIAPSPASLRYLQTKKDKLGHLFSSI